MATVICPISTIYGGSKVKDYVFRLNLNVYRNAHYRILSQAKVSYKVDLMDLNPRLEGMRYKNPVHLTFTLYKPSKRKIDRANICSVVEKFACDALTELGVWDDDNDDYILSTTYKTGGVDKIYPRVEMEICEGILELPEPELYGYDLAKKR